MVKQPKHLLLPCPKTAGNERLEHGTRNNFTSGPKRPGAAASEATFCEKLLFGISSVPFDFLQCPPLSVLLLLVLDYFSCCLHFRVVWSGIRWYHLFERRLVVIP